MNILDQNGVHQTDNFFIDEPCVVSFFIGELGWLVQRWQAYLRHLKQDVYPDHKFLIMLNSQYHVLVQDFVDWTIELPDEFYQLNLETDCYEAPLPGSPAGSLTPSEVWIRLIEYIRQFYNREKAGELWTPRGVNTWVDMQPQLFIKYTTEALIESKRPVITVFPRGRSRAANRNVPEFVWKEVVDNLGKSFNVVLCGTKSGACLVDYSGPGVDNQIGKSSLENVLYLLNNSVCSVSSQSGPTHLSVLSMCPSYIIGHEHQRHAVDDNRFNTPTSFRYVEDYRAIDANTILEDLNSFIQKLQETGEFNSKSRRASKPITQYLCDRERKDLVGAILNYNNVKNIGNILNLLDWKELYLVGIPPEGEQLAELTQLLTEYDKYDKVHWVSAPINEAINLLPDNLDFIYTDTFIPHDLCEDYFYKLKAGGIFGGTNTPEWEQAGLPFQYRLIYKGAEHDIQNRYSENAPDTGWFFKMGGELRDSAKPLKNRKNLIGAEIGVYFGENSKSYLENLHIKTLYLVDPYSQGLVGLENKDAPEYVLKHAKRLLGSGDRLRWIRKSSIDAAAEIPNKLDFVYIDGDHTYDGVYKDIELYWPKVKKGGILGGHDFDNKHIAKAVDNFFDALDENYTIFTAVDAQNTVEFWVYKIPNLHTKVIEDGLKEFDNIIKQRIKNG